MLGVGAMSGRHCGKLSAAGVGATANCVRTASGAGAASDRDAACAASIRAMLAFRRDPPVELETELACEDVTVDTRVAPDIPLSSIAMRAPCRFL